MLYLLRHPKPDIAPGICYGQLDVPLPVNWQQSVSLATIKASLPANVRIVSSPATRCRQLADWLADELVTRPEIDDRIQELDFGDWEGQAWDDINDPQLLRWMNHYLTEPVSGGESWLDLRARVEACLQNHREQDHNQVWVTHAGVIRTLLHLVNGTPMNELFAQTIPYAETIRLE